VPVWLGLWWVHGLMLLLAITMLMRQNRLLGRLLGVNTRASAT